VAETQHKIYVSKFDYNLIDQSMWCNRTQCLNPGLQVWLTAA